MLDCHRIRRAAVLLPLVAVTGLVSVRAGAETVGEICQSLERPAIDCACVERRVDRMREALPASLDPRFLNEGYRAVAGQANRFDAVFESTVSTPGKPGQMSAMAMLKLENALSPFGGLPGAIEDYEQGCVIGGRPRATLPALPREPATESYVERCVASTSDRRYCTCVAARARSRVDRPVFEAYLRSFSDYTDPEARTLAEMNDARARAMGISSERYQALLETANAKIRDNSELDSAYCGALLWPDGAEGDTRASVGARYRQAATTGEGEEGDVVEGSGSAKPGTGGPPAAAAAASADTRYPEAAAVIADSCAADGLDADVCRCLLEAVESDVFSEVSSGNVAMAYVLMAFDSGAEPMKSMQVLSRLSSEEQMAAGMLLSRKDPMARCN